MAWDSHRFKSSRGGQGGGFALANRQKAAALAAGHVEEAIATLVDLMRSSGRESVRHASAKTLLDLACDAEGADDGDVRVYVIDPEQVRQAAAKRLAKGGGDGG